MSIFKKLGWYFKAEWRTYLFGLLGLLITALLAIIPPRMIGVIVDSIHSHQLTGRLLAIDLLILLAAAIGQYGSRYMWRTAIWGAAAKLEKTLRQRLFGHYMTMDQSFYQKYRTGDLMARATNDLQAIQRVAGGGILQFADSIITGGTTLIAMMTLINWRLTLIAVLPFPLLAVMAFYLGQKINIAFRDSQAAFSRLNNKAQESISGVKVIKSLGQEQEDITDFDQQVDQTIKVNRRVNRLDALFDPITTLIIGLAYVATIVMGGSLVVSHVITIGNLVSFITYLSMMIWPIFAVGMLFNTMERGNASYDRVMNLINERSQVIDQTNGKSERPAGDLTFNVAKFNYPDDPQTALSKVSFTISAGKTLGIVGRVGAGKTTIMRLLLRQFEQYQGHISYGDTDILDYQLDSYLPALGYVPQDSFLFSESVRDNIAFAKPEATDAEIDAVVKEADFADQIDQFENGFDTLVGEEGVSLSGGQRQRLAIARALLIKPELLILDDALSAVDAETESKILTNLHDERAGKTTIIAAHRLSSVMQADEIIVMDHGTVTERGNHDQLMAQDGWYHQMFERQELEMRVRGGLMVKNNKQQSAWAKSIPIKEQMGIVARLIGYAKPYWRHFIVAIVLAALISVVNIMLPMILKDYMDNYLKVGRADLKVMWLFAGLYFFAMVVRAFMQFGQAYLYSMGAEYMLESVRRQLFDKLHHLGMRFFDQVPSGSILSRLTNDTMSFSTFWQLFSSLIVALFSVISSVIAMFLLNAKVAVWLLILLPLLGVTIWYYQRYSSKVYRRMRERLSELNSRLSEAITGISIIQQFRQERRMNHEFDDVNSAYFKSRQAMIRINSLLLSPLIDLFYALGVVFVLTLLGVRGLNGIVPAGMIYAFVTYLDNLFNPMTSMMDNLSDFQEGIVSGSRVMKLMADKTAVPTQKPVAGRDITQGKIEFKHVSFSYDGEKPILDDISFVANPGQTVALVGETGSGKSSIINVLMRFYEFQSGQVLIDGHDIREYDYATLRAKMGLVLQEPFLFYGTVASNIRMFNQSISDRQVRAAAQFVNADDMIESLPRGYDSRVIERGNGYSSGQKQLISFARTVVTDPKVLILDEATANVDTETEEEIQKSLAKLQSGRTTIAIAHRLSTIQNADLILVLHQGQIIERGTNDELMAKRGAYYDMIQLQNTAHLD